MESQYNHTFFGISDDAIPEGITTLGGVVTVTKSLVVTLSATTIANGTSCNVIQPQKICGQIFVTPPNGAETQVLVIKISDLVPSGSCLGVHSTSRSATPLSGARGIYTIRFQGANANTLSPALTVNLTPSVLILVDGNPVVNKPYATPLGENNVAESWQFSF